MPGLPRVLVECVNMSQIRGNVRPCGHRAVGTFDWQNKIMCNFNSSLAFYAPLVFHFYDLSLITADAMLWNVLGRFLRVVT